MGAVAGQKSTIQKDRFIAVYAVVVVEQLYERVYEKD